LFRIAQTFFRDTDRRRSVLLLRIHTTERAAMLVVDAVKIPETATPMPRWRVDIVRKHAEHLGIVTAPNAQEALHRAASLFRIKPDQYRKLIITKVEEYDVGRYTD
jgi:hypothetical protein